MADENPLSNEQNRFFVLTVVLDRLTKQVGIKGDLRDKKFCVNLLASGIHALNNIKEEESKILKPVFIPPKDVRKKS